MDLFRNMLITGFLFISILGQCQEDLRKDLLSDYKTFTIDDLETQESFSEVLFSNKKIDRTNFKKAENYFKRKNEFNSNWENRRINHRTKINEIWSQLLLTKSKYQLLNSQLQNLLAEIKQLEQALEEKEELRQKYLATDESLESLKNNILNNYIYYGIFYSEFKIPKNYQEILDIHVESYRDYGEQLIKEQITKYYIDAVVKDRVWTAHGLTMERDLIKDVEMLNLSSSFHISLKLDDLNSREIVLATALFKNDGSNGLKGQKVIRKSNEEQKDIETLMSFASSVKSAPLYRGRSNIDKTEIIKKSVVNSNKTSESVKIDISERFDEWINESKRTLNEIDTKEAYLKWTKELSNFADASEKMREESLDVVEEIKKLNRNLKEKEDEKLVLEMDIQAEKNSWEKLEPEFHRESAAYYHMVENQLYYEELTATNPNNNVSLTQAAFEAVQSEIEELKRSKLRELQKTIYHEIDDNLTFEKSELTAEIVIRELAILNYSSSTDGSDVSVEIPLAVKMDLIIPQKYINRFREPVAPWETYLFNNNSKSIFNDKKTLEWKRIRITSDEDDYGNEYIEEVELVNNIGGGWRVPSIAELIEFQKSTRDSPEKLREFGIPLEDSFPFWSSTTAESGEGGIRKRSMLFYEGSYEVIDLEITEAGIYLLVRDVQ